MHTMILKNEIKTTKKLLLIFQFMLLLEMFWNHIPSNLLIGLHQQQHYQSASTAASRDEYYQFHVVHFVSQDFTGGHYALLHPHNEPTLSTACQLAD